MHIHGTPCSSMEKKQHGIRGYYVLHLHGKLITFHGSCRKFHGKAIHLHSIRTNFQNRHIWAWNLASGKVPEVAHISSLNPRGSKLSSFLLYGQRFSRHGQIFKIAIFGHETWQLAKNSRNCTCILFLHQGVEIELIFALLAAVSQLQPF